MKKKTWEDQTAEFVAPILKETPSMMVLKSTLILHLVNILPNATGHTAFNTLAPALVLSRKDVYFYNTTATKRNNGLYVGRDHIKIPSQIMAQHNENLMIFYWPFY